MFTDNAPTGQAVVDELVLLSQALTGMAPRKHDCQLVLAFLRVQMNVFCLLLGGSVARVGFLSLAYTDKCKGGKEVVKRTREHKTAPLDSFNHVDTASD